MNCEQIQAYGETFTIDERAHAVSELSAWFQLDSWTVREGLLLLVGIDPARSEDLLFSESGFETKPKPTWAQITARPGLSANEVDANGWPHITGLIFNRDELMWLSRLLNLWVATPLHTMTGRHEPRYFVEWAGSKNCTPYWREWALDAKLFIDTAPVQAAATPAPVGAVGASLTHSIRVRRDTLTPVIELAQSQCRNPKDTAEVWAVLMVLAEKKHPPLIGVTEEGLQYYEAGEAAIFKRKSLGARLTR